MKPIRADGYLFAQDYALELWKGLREGRTVTPYVLEPLEGEGASIYFELRVTKVGEKKLPSVRASAQRRG